jgi:hypothetical protein
VQGGAPQKVCDLPALAVGGAWNGDDVIIVGSVKGSLMRCPASGGTASVVTQLDSSRGESAHIFPFFLPDGRRFLYLRISRNAPENSGIYLRALDTASDESTDRRVLATGFGAAYVPDAASGVGRILFVRDAALYAQPFDERQLELSGNGVRVAAPVGSFIDAAFTRPRPTGSSYSEGRMKTASSRGSILEAKFLLGRANPIDTAA